MLAFNYFKRDPGAVFSPQKEGFALDNCSGGTDVKHHAVERGLSEMVFGGTFAGT